MSQTAATEIEQLDACLPQTQCTQCGFPRCRDYAAGIARGDADINQCPPGGDVTIRKLAQVRGCSIKPLDPKYGTHRHRTLAFINEDRCIGCALCLDACPVDAIVGTNKRMHTVIAEHCTGCELCLPPCPVDCIELVHPIPASSNASVWPEYRDEEVAMARKRNERHYWRLHRQAEQKALAGLHRKLRGPAGAAEIRNDLARIVERVRGSSNSAAPGK